MSETLNYHAHIYFDPDQVGDAQALAEEVRSRFDAAVGRFHQQPIGPHPRGSCQLTLAPDRFGEFAAWASLNRRGLTIFAHATTGDDLADHVQHVVWFGPSEPLDLSVL